jgi:hypothetical protein
MNYWLVRAKWGGVDDKTTQFIQNDEWINGYIVKDFLEKKELIIAFHIELPPQRRTLQQSNYDLGDMRKKLRDKLKLITDGQNIKVVSKDNLNNLPWSVSIATP